MSSPVETKPLELSLNASPALVYRAWTNSSALREWLCDVATTEPRPNGRIYLYWNGGFYSTGHFTQLERDQEIAFVWFGRGDPGPSEVVITLEPAGEGTRMKLVQRGLEIFPDPAATAANFEEEWRRSLENLKSVLDEGPDLRITRRPMLGVTLSDFNAEIAAKIGVPQNQGVRLAGVIDGMGAQAAGLQKDDVLVEMDGKPITDFPSLGELISPHRSGDEVEVKYYRGAEKKTTKMKLSGRPIPAIPPTTAALVEQVRKALGEAADALDKAFEDVSQEEAMRKPAPDEWSAMETLAHLVHSERGWQNFLAEMVGGDEPHYDGFGGNVDMRIQATVAAYPTIADMLNEIKRLFAETAEMVTRLPEDFLARKGTHWRLVTNVLNAPIHTEQHLAQIKAAIQAGR
ncbi:MAG: SRPBCC domain-containing protein [Anaerolineales bacterium]|nr:SRPBCC domain-containing protein [Anaerolineales bacterium]